MHRTKNKMVKIINTKLLFFLGVFILTASLFAQGYGDNLGGGHKNGGYAYSTNTDNDGNVYITGSMQSTNGFYNFCTIKYSQSGSMLWTKTYGGPGIGDDKAYAIVIDKDAFVYVTGYSTVTGNVHNITTVKYNTNGTQQWAATYTSTGNSEATAVVVDDKGNVYVCGYTTTASGNINFITIKYNKSGQQQWANIYDGTPHLEDKAYAIVVDKTNNVYVTGYSTVTHSSQNNTDYITIKYKPNGSQEWVALYNGTGNGDDKAYAITIDKSNNIYITGSSTVSNGITDCVTIKYKQNGNQKWLARYHNQGYGAGGNAITVDVRTNVFVTGWANHVLNGNSDYLTIKYNSDGDQEWVKIYNGNANGDDIAKSITVDNQQNIYVTGSSKMTGPYGIYFHYATVKYNRSGTQQWCVVYTYDSYEDDAYAIAIDYHGNLIVTGASMRNASNYDYATVQYSSDGQQRWVARSSTGNDDPENGTKETQESVNGQEPEHNNISGKNSEQITTEFQLSQNYPNPFNPTTLINYQIPADEFVELKVYDVLGKEVSTLVNEFKRAGTYKINFNGTALESGVYFYRIKAGNFIDIKKMILVK
ncbi:MAG: SBBP repeat-containing protein [Ignavibacteria bacterium]